MKKIGIIVLVVGILALLIIGSSLSPKKEKKEDIRLNYTLSEGIYEIEGNKYEKSTKPTDLVFIDVENIGGMVAELYPKVAPITVKNFKKLVSEEFYKKIIFHRVIENFMIQGGDPEGTGQGGSEDNIKGEFSENGVKNNISHERGVLSMARRGADPDTDETRNSASSQFFIMHKDNIGLDGKYAAFGKLLQGYDVLDTIATVSTDSYDKPLDDVVINNIIFLTKAGE